MPSRRHRPVDEPETDSEIQRISPSSPDRDPPPPFFNTTFSTHRISPLYIGANALRYPRLETLSQRLRDTLVGDVVRGVQVGLEGSDSSLGRAGTLERVRMRWVAVDALLGGADDADADQSRDLSSDNINGDVEQKKRALALEIRYEHAMCTAILLPSLAGKSRDAPNGLPSAKNLDIPGLPAGHSSSDDRHFLQLPLLLLRMPTPLKGIIIDFLSSTFDCRVSPMRLGTRSLTSAWERWIQDAGLPSKGPLAKDMVLTLGFYIPAAEATEGEGQAAEALGIKSIDIIIPANELQRFTKEGQAIAKGDTNTAKRKAISQGYENDARERKRLAGGKSDEGWGWRAGDGARRQPFLDAVGYYLDQHLALDLFHPGVRVTKIACGGFVLSEGRVKVFVPPGDDEVFEPVRNLIGDLITSAAG